MKPHFKTIAAIIAQMEQKKSLFKSPLIINHILFYLLNALVFPLLAKSALAFTSIIMTAQRMCALIALLDIFLIFIEQNAIAIKESLIHHK